MVVIEMVGQLPTSDHHHPVAGVARLEDLGPHIRVHLGHRLVADPPKGRRVLHVQGLEQLVLEEPRPAGLVHHHLPQVLREEEQELQLLRVLGLLEELLLVQERAEIGRAHV